MASVSDRRYQSRLFNFVHQQVRRVSEQCEQAFRHLQVSTNWGVQVLLYPIYLLFQGTKLAGKQLHSPVQQSWLELPADDTDSQPQTAPTADTPIQRVLLLVDALQLEEPVASPVVRAIATQLSNRTLVLITAQNEILNILTPQQQKKLQERIIGEVTDYWRHTVSPSSSPLVLFRNQALGFLDRTVAKLESSHLAPVSEVAQTHTLRIQALIWAAINYFFGTRGRKLGQTMPTGDSLPSAQLPSRPQAVSADVDPWLTLSDLFGKPESEGELSSGQAPELSASQSKSQLAEQTSPALPSSQTASLTGYSLRQKLYNRLQALSSLGKGIEKVASKQLSPLPKSPKRVSDGEISHQPSSQGTQLEPAPEWLETHATAMGYVKHPLEQLLEWLDRAMLWLEELLVRVLQWVRSSV